MTRPRWWRRLPTYVHLALGLAAIAVGSVLAAGVLGLVPDVEGLQRMQRAQAAETLAVTTSALLDEAQPDGLKETLGFLRERQAAAGLQSVGVRRADGELLIESGPHAEAWGAAATDTRVSVPVFQAGEPWGTVELRYTPLRPAGWRAHLADPGLRLALFVSAVCAVLFTIYMRRMLRELDPSRAVPARVRTAYDTLAEGLLVLDAQGAVVLANRATATLLGLDEKRLVGRSPAALGWSDSSDAALPADSLPWTQALHSGRAARDVPLHFERQDGRRFALRANCSPIADERGGVQALVVSFQDVTELEARGKALLAAKEQADAANVAKSAFLANMSHEIRTPMNAILGFTEVLRRGGLRHGEEAVRQLDIIHASGRHLLAIINDILDLSKVEAGRLEAERIAFAPHEVLNEVVRTLEHRAQDKALTLSAVYAEPMPALLEGDPARLRQVLTNLVGNAIKFTERGGVRVAARLDRRAGALRYAIDVQDTGIGIAPAQLDAIFEPFVQAEASTTRRFGGTGLGLTISRGFARAMGGDIDVASHPGEGTTFTVWLPADEHAARLAPAELARVQPRALQAAARWRFPPLDVLVVDDGAENRQLVKVLLEDAGLRVHEAENGQRAVDLVPGGSFAAVLMDMQMPVMDGATATRTLRSLGCTLPIVALTANAMKGFERQLDDAGFSGHLVKPIDVDVLLSDLGKRLGGHAESERVVETTAMGAHAAGLPQAEVDDAPIASRLAAHPKLGRIAARFAAGLPQQLDAMARSLSQGDFASLGAQAHAVKGAGGSMGYDALFEPARELESAALAADASAAQFALATLQRLAGRIGAAALLTESPLK